MARLMVKKSFFDNVKKVHLQYVVLNQILSVKGNF